MSKADLIAIAGFFGLFAMMASGIPVGVAMGIVGVAGFGAVVGFGPALSQLITVPFRAVTDYNMSLVPMFILMGVLATRSGMSRELFRAANAWIGHMRGGLAMATITSCAGFAAISGSSIATAATMTKVALPELRKYNYPDQVSGGVVAAGGTLGILIPPSVVLAIYAFITEQDVGKLFIAGVIPGIIAFAMYLFCVRIAFGKILPAGVNVPWRDRYLSLRGIWAVLLLFVSVIGGIYFGVVTPTEAAAAGAFLTWAIGALRRRLSVGKTLDCLIEALRTSVAIYTIVIGALLFSYFLAVTQTPQKLTEFLLSLGFGPYPTLLLIMAFFLLVGCILDAMAMIILLVPIVYPVILALGFDPIWFGIIIVMTVELGLITPPIGMNVFVINSVERSLSLPTIFRGVIPFILTDILRLLLFIMFPALILYLPSGM